MALCNSLLRAEMFFLGCRVYVTAVLLSQCMVFKKLSRQYVKHVVKPQPTAGRQYVPFGLPFLS